MLGTQLQLQFARAVVAELQHVPDARRPAPRHLELHPGHPNPTFPNLTMLRDNSTGLYANINHNETGDGT
ncbi:hypothetical protein [Streptomyces sp. NPDC001415]